jgi:predicted O-methyltransferase YrrM
MTAHKNSHPAIPYIQALYAKEDDLLREIRETLAARNTAWSVGAEEGRLLQVLLTLHGTKRVVEIGTLGGYSTIWMARALPQDGHIITLDHDPKHCELARGFFARSNVADKITLVEGDAKASLQTLTAPFDAVFIDADKPSYNVYLNWAEKNIRTGGLIIADNTLLFGTAHLDKAPEGVAPTTWNTMREFNQRLADTSKYVSVMVPTEEGLTVAVKR